MGIVENNIIVLDENKISNQSNKNIEKSDSNNDSHKPYILIGLFSICGNIFLSGII